MNSFDMKEFCSAWDEALRAGDFRRCLLIAAEAYATAADTNAVEEEKILVNFVKLAADKVCDQSSIHNRSKQEEVCAFCHEPPRSKKIVRGPQVLICETCIATASHLLVDE